MTLPIESAFTSEKPRCPFNQCDMCTNTRKIGSGWDFEYLTTQKEINYLQCQQCDLVFQEMIPDTNALEKIYPDNYYSFTEATSINKFVSIFRNWMARQKGKDYKKLIPASEANIIDIGCGDGRLLDVLKLSCPSGWQLYGLDWSEQAIERIRSKGYKGYSGDVTKLDAPELKEFFDLVIMHQVIEHVHSPRETLSKLSDILKIGGILTIETPDINSWDFNLLHDRYWSGYHIPRHFYIFNKKNFVELAEELGFEVVSTRSLVNPVAWIHSIKGYCADNKFLKNYAHFFNHNNPIMLSIFTPLELIQTKFAKKSSNMQINLKKVKS